jgi:transcriptional regulator with XRE-family HTH domain
LLIELASAVKACFALLGLTFSGDAKSIKIYLASVQNFAQRLGVAISSSGKSKGALAADAGVALSTVSRWCSGVVPKAETLDQIARFLGVDAKWLLTGEGASSAPLGDLGGSAVPSPAPAADPSEVLERIAAALERIAAVLEGRGPG